MIRSAKQNLSLLSKEGLHQRKAEIDNLYQQYGKMSHKEAIESCDRLEGLKTGKITTNVFEADCTKSLPKIYPDIIITDIPYGNLVEWDSSETTILAVYMDKKQKTKCISGNV